MYKSTAIFFSTDKDLFEDFVNRSGVYFEIINRRSDFSIGAQAHKNAIDNMPTFNKLFKNLNAMKNSQ